MIVVTVLVIISFVAFYNGTRSTNHGGGGTPDKVAIVYNRSLTMPDFEKGVRRYYVARQLGLAELIQLLGLGNNQNEQVQNFVLNRLVLQHEADQLLISPTADEVKAEEKRIFQTNGEFDAQKLNAYVEQGLAPMGFNASVIDDLVTNAVQLRKLKQLVGSSVDVSEAELRSNCNQVFQKSKIDVIRFSLADLLAGVHVSDEDVQKAYDQRKEGLKSDEKRKISFVTYALSDADNTLKDSNRIDALQKLANKANDFIVAASAKEARFNEVAAQLKVPVVETGEFTQASPDAALEKLPGVVTAAFKLTQDNPTEAVQAGATFYIVHLESVTPSHPLTLDEARPKLTEQLKTDRARETLSAKATVMRGTIETAIKDGKSPLDAARQQQLKVEDVPVFTIGEFPPEATPEQQQIAMKSFELKPGQLSEFVPTTGGGCLIFVEKRTPMDDAKYAEVKEKSYNEYLARKQAFAFLEWLRIRRDAAKIQFVSR